MNRTSPTDDNLDQLLAAYFKAQVPKPWPAPPATSEPSELVAGRAGESETHPGQPAVAPRDSARRARHTLAASVALLLGACWMLSNGFQSGGHATGPIGPNGLNGIDLKNFNAKTPQEITDVLTPPVTPRGGKNDMLDKSN